MRHFAPENHLETVFAFFLAIKASHVASSIVFPRIGQRVVRSEPARVLARSDGPIGVLADTPRAGVGAAGLLARVFLPEGSKRAHHGDLGSSEPSCARKCQKGGSKYLLDFYEFEKVNEK